MKPQITPEDLRALAHACPELGDKLIAAANEIERLKPKHDAFETLENCCWDVRCIDCDDTWMWQIVGHYMGDKPYRTLGESWEGDGLLMAVKNAQETTNDDGYNYLYVFQE